MGQTRVIRENYLRNFICILLVILLIGTAVSTLTLYLYVQRPLDTHYSAVISIITDIKESLAIHSLKINVALYLLIAAGVGLLTLLYTHRIAGPLYRIKMSTRAIAKGDLNTVITLRRKDAIESFAHSINKMTVHYADKVRTLKSEVNALKREINKARGLKENNEDSPPQMEDIHALDSKINTIINASKG